jgi:DHA1 family bicyclomycin/chloramphenicol resistance-like MFS transporter
VKHPDRHPPRLPAGAATIALLTFLAALGQFSTSVNLPSFPSIARELAAPMPLVQLTLTVYLATMAALQLVGGPLADRFGRRRVVFAGLAIFLAGSLLATLAPDLAALTAGRALQAASAAGCAVASRAVVRDSFEGAEIARAMAAIAIAFAVVPAAAPIIGGVLEDLAGWRWAMATTVAAGAVGLAVVAARLPETNRSLLDSIAPLAIARAYVAVFADANFRRWTIVVAGTMGGLFASTAGWPDILIGRLGLSATAYGLTSIVTVAAFVGGGVVTRRLVARLGEERLAGWGLALLWLGAALLLAPLLAGHLGLVAILGATAVWTAGVGMLLPTAMGVALRGFPERAGTASALLGFAQGGAAALGAAATSALTDALGALAFPVALAACTALAAAGFATARRAA